MGACKKTQCAAMSNAVRRDVQRSAPHLPTQCAAMAIACGCVDRPAQAERKGQPHVVMGVARWGLRLAVEGGEQHWHPVGSACQRNLSQSQERSILLRAPSQPPPGGRGRFRAYAYGVRVPWPLGGRRIRGRFRHSAYGEGDLPFLHLLGEWRGWRGLLAQGGGWEGAPPQKRPPGPPPGPPGPPPRPSGPPKPFMRAPLLPMRLSL